MGDWRVCVWFQNETRGTSLLYSVETDSGPHNLLSTLHRALIEVLKWRGVKVTSFNLCGNTSPFPHKFVWSPKLLSTGKTLTFIIFLKDLYENKSLKHFNMHCDLCSKIPLLLVEVGAVTYCLSSPIFRSVFAVVLWGKVASLLPYCESLQVNLCQAVGDIMQSVFYVGCLRLVTVGPPRVTSHLILAVCILKENIFSTVSFCHHHENIRQKKSKTLPAF